MYRIIGADGREYGPVTGEQLRQWIAEGRVNAQTRVWVEGAAAWRPLVEFAEFAPLLAAAPVAVPGPIGPTAPYATGPRTNPLAITGLVMGILALTVGCCCYGVPFNVLGVIFSLVALSQIKHDPQNQRGRGQAIAGLILSLFSFVLGAVMGVISALNPDVLHKLQQL
jgi:hypothetical protein